MKSITSSTFPPLYKERLIVTNKFAANFDYWLRSLNSSIAVTLLTLLNEAELEVQIRAINNIAIVYYFIFFKLFIISKN